MTVAADAPLIAVLFGPPGSGKGTQAGFIASTFDLVHVSTGDMLRAEVENGTELGREVEPVMASGQLVSDDLIVRVIASRLRQLGGHRGLLLDGFPRTVAQAEALDAAVLRGGRKVDILLVLEVPEDQLRERILRRAELEERADDTPEVVERRIEVYRTETAPVVDYYASSGANVQRIDGVGTIEDVQERLRRAFDSVSGGTVSQ